LVDIQKTDSKNQRFFLEGGIQKTYSKNIFKKPIQKTDSKNRFKKPIQKTEGAKRRRSEA